MIGERWCGFLPNVTKLVDLVAFRHLIGGRFVQIVDGVAGRNVDVIVVSGVSGVSGVVAGT